MIFVFRAKAFFGINDLTESGMLTLESPGTARFSANASNSDEYGGISSASKVAADRTNSKIYFFISLSILKMVPVFQLCETGFFIKSTIRPKSAAETGFLLYRGNRKYPLSPAASSFPEDAIFPSGEVVVLQKNFPHGSL